MNSNYECNYEWISYSSYFLVYIDNGDWCPRICEKNMRRNLIYEAREYIAAIHWEWVPWNLSFGKFRLISLLKCFILVNWRFQRLKQRYQCNHENFNWIILYFSNDNFKCQVQTNKQWIAYFYLYIIQCAPNYVFLQCAMKLGFFIPWQTKIYPYEHPKEFTCCILINTTHFNIIKCKGTWSIITSYSIVLQVSNSHKVNYQTGNLRLLCTTIHVFIVNDTRTTYVKINLFLKGERVCYLMQY